MAIQAQMYQDNLLLGLPPPASQNSVVGIGDDCNGLNDLFLNLHQKQLQQRQQQWRVLQNQIQSHHQQLMFKKQRQEIDECVRLQNERLRVVLQEQRRSQLAAVMKQIELKTQILLARKDQEIAEAAKKTMELESFVNKLEMENQAWQRVAHENEAMVVNLNNSLEQLREMGCSATAADDAESCCGGEEGEETEQNRGGGETEEEQSTRKMVMVCKSCKTGKLCMLFLPCRHLCSCQACDAFLDSCPVCKTVKKASIEALIF